MKHKLTFSMLFQCSESFKWLLRSLFVFLFVFHFLYFAQEHFAFGQEKNAPIVSLTVTPDSETNFDSLFIGGKINHQFGVRGYRIYNNYKVIGFE
jgi:hypothetical protein